ncbi:hypothetical protein [Moorella sp. ACPs]|uniref:hypothetical protein n=1 Tax=Neomoorella carbonis TaxID=3062783 RepID=UPI003872E82C
MATPFRGGKVFASKLHLPGKIRLEKPFFLLQVKKLPLFVAVSNAGKIDVKPCRCLKAKKDSHLFRRIISYYSWLPFLAGAKAGWLKLNYGVIF